MTPSSVNSVLQIQVRVDYNVISFPTTAIKYSDKKKLEEERVCSASLFKRLSTPAGR